MFDQSPTSWLFVPADRPDRFGKALRAGADEVILDLEDAVAQDAKRAARAHVVDWLSDRHSSWVRINRSGTPWHVDDIDAVACCDGLRGLVVPKAEEPGVITAIAARVALLRGVDRPIVALVETALGVLELDALSRCPAISRLAFGSIDFALDIDAHETDEALLHARSSLVVASRAAGLPSPIEGVTVDVRNPDLVIAAARRARALGFGGKLCIHPRQVEAVNAAFAPTEAELEWARRVLSAVQESDGSAFTLDGRMVDEPVLARAKRIIERCRQR